MEELLRGLAATPEFHDVIADIAIMLGEDGEDMNASFGVRAAGSRPQIVVRFSPGDFEVEMTISAKD